MTREYNRPNRGSGSRAAWGWFLALGGLAVAVKGGWLGGVDRLVAQWAQGMRTPAVDQLALAVTFFGSGPWTVGVACLMGLWWWRSRQQAMLMGFVLAWALAVGVQAALRLWVAHWRPDTVVAFDAMTLWQRFDLAGFPSGHAFRSAYLSGWWGQALVRRGTRWSQLGAAGLVGCVVLIGSTRLYLNRHWLTDVVGGWCLALAALALACRFIRVGD